MTNRERFKAAMHFEPTDYPCHVEWGFWHETYLRWKDEGLPSEVTEPTFFGLSEGIDLFRYFGIVKFGYLPIEKYYIPPFEYEILDETDDWRIERTSLGVIQKVSKRSPTLPQFLDYPIKSRKDYEAFRERLNSNINIRYPKNWDEIAKSLREQSDTLVVVHIDGFFGYPREIMGLENFLLTFYDDPNLIREIINDRVEFYKTLYEKAIRDTQPDCAFIWEDMCYKKGPLLSPALVREFLLPAYKELTGYFRDMGVVDIVVDSDGNTLELIPLWLEGGITGHLPFEVKAGMDIVKIGELFPNLRILGGINKHKLELGLEEIDEEVDRVLPRMSKRGGYIVALDHWVHPEIPLKNYEYFVEKIRKYKDK